MMGRGSWPRYYREGDDYRASPQGRDAHGVYAIKRELVYTGYGLNIVVDLPYYGSAMTARVKEFQQARGLIVDGVIGPRTCAALFAKRCAWVTAGYAIPDKWVARVAYLESVFDPVAEGLVDADDEGIMQINLRYQTGVTVEQAWTPAFAIKYGASNIADSINEVGDAEGGVAAWNVGRYYATMWTKAGKPPSGGPLLGGTDVFTRAWTYVDRAKKAPV